MLLGRPVLLVHRVSRALLGLPDLRALRVSPELPVPPAPRGRLDPKVLRESPEQPVLKDHPALRV